MQIDSPTYILSQILKELGFSKKNPRLWLRGNESSWNLVGLQKSVLGPQFFVNLGIWFPVLDTNPQPRLEDSHIQIRLNMVSGNSIEVESALDFDEAWKTDTDTRKFELHCAFKDAETKFFGLFGSVETVASYFARRPFGHFAIQRDLLSSLQKLQSMS